MDRANHSLYMGRHLLGAWEDSSRNQIWPYNLDLLATAIENKDFPPIKIQALNEADLATTLAPD